MERATNTAKLQPRELADRYFWNSMDGVRGVLGGGGGLGNIAWLDAWTVQVVSVVWRAVRVDWDRNVDGAGLDEKEGAPDCLHDHGSARGNSF